MGADDKSFNVAVCVWITDDGLSFDDVHWSTLMCGILWLHLQHTIVFDRARPSREREHSRFTQVPGSGSSDFVHQTANSRHKRSKL